MEYLSGVNKLVFISDDLRKLLGFVSGIACADSVNKGIAEVVVVIEPVNEIVAKLPKLGILQNTFLEVIGVVVNKLAREQNEAVKARLEALIQKCSELCGIGLRRCIGKLFCAEVFNACLGGIGDNNTKVGVMSKLQISLIVNVRVDCTGD